LQPSYVIVYGDTNSTLAGALASKDVNCKLVHIEAGLRCFDLSKHEERNRIQVDSMSDYFLAPTELSKLFLKYENISSDKVFVTGNLIVDVCKKFSKASSSRLRSDPRNDLPSQYILLTLHRPALVDDPNMLKMLSVFLSRINYKIVFPIHPRTKNRLIKYNINLPQNVTTIDAVGYSDFISLLKNCIMVMTDSGGVQEEAVILKKSCITLNNTT
jgi:UDP-N-acetylglucosamine 2-epimerase